MVKRSFKQHDSYAVTFFLIYTAYSSGMQDGDSQSCSLPCPDGSVCVVGVSNSSSTSSTPQKGWKGMHCACPPGKTGLLCESEWESCMNNPDKNCLNNGTCELDMVDFLGNKQFSCNCGSAIDSNKGIAYVGDFCEHEYTLNISTQCSLPCLNGQCVFGRQNATIPPFWINYFDIDHDGKNELESMHCVCTDGFDGPLCEIERAPCGQSEYCYYGSQCVSHVENNAAVRECDCNAANTYQVSYAGDYCQYKVTQFCLRNEESSSGNLFCVNGGTCRSNIYDGCDCPVGFDGAFCEIALEGNTTSTYVNSDEKSNQLYDVCTIDANPVQGLPLSFCVNGGKCKAKVTLGEVHPGCICEIGFIGPHCELRDSVGNFSNRTNDDGEYTDGTLSSKSVSLLVVGLLFGFMCLVGLLMYRRQRNKSYVSNKSYINWAKKYQDQQDSVDETNIAPRRDSAFTDGQGSRLIDAHSFASNRDPMITRLVPAFMKSSTSVASIYERGQASAAKDDHYIKEFQNEKDGILRDKASKGKQDRSQQVFTEEVGINAETKHMNQSSEILIVLGPPKDEDGHILHSVEII